MLLDECRVPVVLAPLAGGPSTPELCAAVTEAGGLGFLAAGYLAAGELAARIDRTRELTARPFGVNLFAPTTDGDPAAVEAYARRLQPEARKAGVRLGEPRADDDDWAAKLDLLTASPVPLVSFTFGCPPADVIARVQRVGSEVWVTVTSLDEAHVAVSAGANGVVVQGFEAGGHRGGFTDTDDATGLLALLQLIGAAVSLPLIAAGGIMTGAGLAAVLTAGLEPVHWAQRSSAAQRQARRRCTGTRWSSRNRRRSPGRSPVGLPAVCGTGSSTSTPTQRRRRTRRSTT